MGVQIEMNIFHLFYFHNSCFVILIFQTNASGLAAYVTSQIDSSLSWKVGFAMC